MDEIIRFKGNEYKNIDITTNSKYAPKLLSFNTEHIQPGKEYTYKQLCELTNQPVKYGASKTRQLLEFSRFIEYEKNNTKYKILTVYDPPIPYIPIIQTSHKYNTDMINVILAYLYSSGKEIIYLSYMDFILICGLANELYKKYGKEYAQLSKDYNIDIKQVGDFYSTSYQTFKKIINNALDSMQKRGIIQCINTYVIAERTSNDQTNRNVQMREATDREYIDLMVIQDDVIKELGLKDKNELWYKPSYKIAYNKLFYEKVKEKYPYWEYCYKTIKILSPAVLIRRAVDSDEIRRQLNLKVFNVLHDKTIKQYTDLISSSPEATAQTWLENQTTLEETLVRLMS